MKTWPVGQLEPFEIKNDFSWREIGVLFRVIDEYKVGLVIETGVGSGDIAAWMMCKCWFNPDFHYTGITMDLECVHPKIKEMMPHVPQAFIAPGLSYSDAIIEKVRKFVANSFHPVMVFCNGSNQTKEFDAYMQRVLRPGDVIVVAGFPVYFSLSAFNKFVNTEKLKRFAADMTIGTRLIGGCVL